MKKGAAGALLVVLLTSSLALPATRVSVATGPWGGVFFLVGTALAHLLSKHVRDTTAIGGTADWPRARRASCREPGNLAGP